MSALFRFLGYTTVIFTSCMGLLYAALLTGWAWLFVCTFIFVVPVFLCNVFAHAAIAHGEHTSDKQLVALNKAYAVHEKNLQEYM